MACKWCGDLFDHCLVHPSPFWKHALVKKQYLGILELQTIRKSNFGSSPPPSICPPFLLFLETTPSKLHETEKVETQFGEPHLYNVDLCVGVADADADGDEVGTTFLLSQLFISNWTY